MNLSSKFEVTNAESGTRCNEKQPCGWMVHLKSSAFLNRDGCFRSQMHREGVRRRGSRWQALRSDLMTTEFREAFGVREACFRFHTIRKAEASFTHSKRFARNRAKKRWRPLFERARSTAARNGCSMCTVSDWRFGVWVPQGGIGIWDLGFGIS